MKEKFLFSLLLAFVLIGGFVLAPSVDDLNEPGSEYAVKAIHLEGDGNSIEWSVDGYSMKGFKVVWSKNEGPTYPTRKGDKYLYFSSPEAEEAELSAFDGDGQYHVRVCEYLGGKCGVYSNEIVVDLVKDKKVEEKEEYKKEYKKELREKGEEEKIFENCNGCVLEENCVPICYRSKGNYCALGGEFKSQMGAGSPCDNNCECKSNVCANGECVSGNLIKKVLEWLKGFFG